MLQHPSRNVRHFGSIRGVCATAMSPNMRAIGNRGKKSLVARRGTSSTKTTEETRAPSSATAAPVVDFDALPIGEKLLFVAVETFTQGVASGVMGGLAGLVYGAFSRRTLEGARSEGRKFLMTWGLFGGVYSLGLGLSRTVRQRQDKYNAVIAACASGAVFGREQGVQGMLAGCAQFAGFTYLIETFIVGSQSPRSERDNEIGSPKIEIPVGKRR
jgi:import inner membrane translocase subunit TIM22